MLVKQRFRNQVKDFKSLLNAVIYSDYNPVIIKCSLKFKIIKKVTRTDDCNIAKLQDKETREHFEKAVTEELASTGGSEVMKNGQALNTVNGFPIGT